MRNRCAILFVLSFSCTSVLAMPYWCGGDEALTDHPLSEESLKSKINSTDYLPAKYTIIQNEFLSYVTSAGIESEEQIVKLTEDLHKLTEPDSGDAYKHQRFRRKALSRRGYPARGCDISPDNFAETQPDLAAIHATTHMVFLVGRESVAQEIPSLAEAVMRRRTDSEAWLLNDGLAQWPWEMWLNGKLLDLAANKPTPTKQFIFLRPSVGINMSFPRQEDADITPTGVVEIIGLIRYRESYKKHWGISLMADIDSDLGAGIGLAIRYNGYWAGYVVHGDDRPDAMYVGLDLLKILQSPAERKTLANEFVQDALPLVSPFE